MFSLFLLLGLSSSLSGASDWWLYAVKSDKASKYWIYVDRNQMATEENHDGLVRIAIFVSGNPSASFSVVTNNGTKWKEYYMASATKHGSIVTGWVYGFYTTGFTKGRVDVKDMLNNRFQIVESLYIQ